MRKASKRGAANHNARLAEEDVQRIKELTGKVPQRALALAYDVSRRTVQSVQTGGSWQSLWTKQDQARLDQARRDGSYRRGARCGSQHPMARLTENQARLIRDLKGTFTQKKLAEMFDVSKGHVKDILAGKRWRCIQPDKDTTSAEEIRLLYNRLPAEVVALSFNTTPDEVKKVWQEAYQCQV